MIKKYVGFKRELIIKYLLFSNPQVKFIALALFCFSFSSKISIQTHPQQSKRPLLSPPLQLLLYCFHHHRFSRICLSRLVHNLLNKEYNCLMIHIEDNSKGLYCIECIYQLVRKILEHRHTILINLPVCLWQDRSLGKSQAGNRSNNFQDSLDNEFDSFQYISPYINIYDWVS